jgi:hypothetical protein
MSITAQHLISDIREIASSGGNPNEFKITDAQILFWVEEVRSQLISQSLAKRDDINDSWIQYIPCIELELADESECCDAPSGCFVLKTKRKLPSTIDTWKDNWIVAVSTADGSMIPKSNVFKNRYQKYNKYTGSSRSWYIKNDFMYVVNNTFLEIIEVAGLFETPSELSSFPSCSGSPCFSLDSPYPVSLTLATQITDIIIKTKVAPFMQFQMDNSNDASGANNKDKGEEKQVN